MYYVSDITKSKNGTQIAYVIAVFEEMQIMQHGDPTWRPIDASTSLGLIYVFTREGERYI